MRCPYCQQPTYELATACACGFSMAALDKLYGMAPVMQGGVTDSADELSRGDRRQLAAQLARLERLFPQVRFAVVLTAEPPGATLAVYACWLFNRAGFASAVERGGSNRVILLVVDSQAGRAACMIGYGLEPLMAETRLQAALQSAQPYLAGGQTAKGIAAFLEAMETQLEEVAEQWPQAYAIGEFEFQSLEHLAASERAGAALY